MSVVDINSGKIITTIPIGAGVDAVAYDAAALTAFNTSVPPGGLTYVKLPSNFYKINNPTVKIPAGTAISEAIKIDIYADMLDPAVSYMFPISITAISGASSDVVKAPATSTAYLHVIGNPIAGNYVHLWQRWNGSAAVGHGRTARSRRG